MNESQTSESADAKGSIMRRKRSIRIVAITIVLLIIAASGTVAWYFTLREVNPVPENLRDELSFPVYYPAEEKLPAGYYLDRGSFSSPQKDTLIYKVRNGAETLIFSVQLKPADSEIQNFYTNVIPLRNHLLSSLGPVEVGAYNNKGTIQSVASLPISKDPTWVIVTYTHDISDDSLKQVLESLKK